MMWCRFNASVWLERGGDGTKRYRKMKQRQQVHLGSMGKKRDTTRRHGDIDQRRGDIEEGEREETMLIELTRILLGPK
jgi:hypothetical protein